MCVVLASCSLGVVLCSNTRQFVIAPTFWSLFRWCRVTDCSSLYSLPLCVNGYFIISVFLFFFCPLVACAYRSLHFAIHVPGRTKHTSLVPQFLRFLQFYCSVAFDVFFLIFVFSVDSVKFGMSRWVCVFVSALLCFWPFACFVLPRRCFMWCRIISVGRKAIAILGLQNNFGRAESDRHLRTNSSSRLTDVYRQGLKKLKRSDTFALLDIARRQ